MDFKKYAKDWITHNVCDGTDRSQVQGDKHIFNSAELYALMDEIIDDWQDHCKDIEERNAIETRR